MSTDLNSLLTDLVTDPRAAGIRRLTNFVSPMPTVTPPAGTLHDGKSEIHGEFTLPDGRLAASVDQIGSQASRMETATETVAEEIGYPLIRFVNEEGSVLTTSAQLSHRHTDATWRASRGALEAAGVPFEEIQSATVAHADALLRWYPLAIPFGWWHSHTLTTDPKKALDKEKNRLKAVGGDKELSYLLAGYARLAPDSRSARVITSEIVAIVVARRRRMAARSDSLFGPLKGGEKSAAGTSTGPSSLGLGSLPPVAYANAPVDVTYESIQGYWFLSLAGLRQFGFDEVDPVRARVLIAAYGLYIHAVAQLETRLRSGTELIATAEGSSLEVLKHGLASTPFPDFDLDELKELVRALGTELGWDGPRDVLIPKGSALDRLLHHAVKESAE